MVLIYNSSKENTTIWIYSLDPNNFLANDSYKIAKDEILNQMKQYEFNPSKHNYDGVVYKIKNTTTGNSTYAITLFYDDKNSIILLTSDNLDTLIHMANTFKLIRPYFIQILNSDTSSIYLLIHLIKNLMNQNLMNHTHLKMVHELLTE